MLFYKTYIGSKRKFLKFNVFLSKIISLVLFATNSCKASTKTGKQLQKIGSLKIKPLKTLHYTPSRGSPLFPLKTILESLWKRSCLLAVNSSTVSYWRIQMSAAVKTNVQCGVLTRLPSVEGFSQRQQSKSAHSNSTHSWLDGGCAQAPQLTRSTTASCLLGSTVMFSLLLLGTQLCLGNLKGKNGRPVMTKYSIEGQVCSCFF